MKNTLTKARVAAASVMAAVAIGAGLMAAPTASAITADDLTYTEFAYAYTYGSGAICPVFENHPTANGLLGIAKSIMSDGFVPEGAGRIILYSVEHYCPWMEPTLINIVNQATEPSSPHLDYAV